MYNNHLDGKIDIGLEFPLLLLAKQLVLVYPYLHVCHVFHVSQTHQR